MWKITGRNLINKAFYTVMGLVFLASGATPLTGVASAAISRPRILDKYNGIYDAATAPPSATMAASPHRQMELVNSKYTIVNRTGTGVSGSISDLAGASGTFLSDPQVMWDPSTNRFYFSLFENRGSSSPDEGLVWGFSKTATPSSAADFCSYFSGFNYGSTSFPDRQSLGDSGDFLLIASDRFSTSNLAFLGADAAWIAKPPAGSTCPAQTSFRSGIQSLKNPDGSTPYSPVPARQVDSNGTSWIAATPSFNSSSSLSLFNVTKKADGSALISSPTSLPVPAYSSPPLAPQAGLTATGQPAPALQTRIYLTQVYMAYDPRVGHNVLWTAHTIAGGAGSQVRWYEINPVANTTDQVGSVSDPTLYVFNGTIASDRLVNGTTSLFGSSAVVNVNTSSHADYTAIQIVSKQGTLDQSKLKRIKQSPGANVDFTCLGTGTNYCRWGDYSGASPDPGAPTNAAQGQVWISNQWNVASKNDSGVDWRTTISLIRP